MKVLKTSFFPLKYQLPIKKGLIEKELEYITHKYVNDDFDGRYSFQSS